MCKIYFFIILYIYIISVLSIPITTELNNYCPPGVECNNIYRKKFEKELYTNKNIIDKNLVDSNINNSNNAESGFNTNNNADNSSRHKYKFMPNMDDAFNSSNNQQQYNQQDNQQDDQQDSQQQDNQQDNLQQTDVQNDGSTSINDSTTIPGVSAVTEQSTSTTYENVNDLGSNVITDNDNSKVISSSSKEMNNNKETEKEPKSKNKIVMFLLGILAVIVALILGLVIYKKKHTNVFPEKEISIEPGFKTGNLLEKIQAMKEMEEMKNTSQGTLLNYSILNPELSSIHSSSREITLSNALDPSFKNPEQYSRIYDSLNRGLKPPPCRDNNYNNKKILNGGSPLVISTNRKSKYSDSSKSQNTNSECFSISRSSTDISQCITPTTSHSSNGIFYGYKNNKLNKHTSVALTFGCPSLSEKDEDSVCSPTRTSYNISSNHSSSRISSRLSSVLSSRLSSSRSISSFLTNSPITQSFKNRISILYNRGNTNDKRIYNEPDRMNNMENVNNNKKHYISVSEFGNNVKFDSTAENKKSNKTNGFKDFDISSPVESAFTYENSTELLIDNNKYNTFLNDNDKKLDLSLKNYN